MNDQEANSCLFKAIGYFGIENVLERLTPAGDHPRLVGEHAERAGNMEPTTDQGQSLRVGQTKERVKIQRILAAWVAKAGMAREEALKIGKRPFTELIVDNLNDIAAVLESNALEIVTALGIEPLTQSEVDGVEECPDCKNGIQSMEIDGKIVFSDICPTCKGRGGDAGNAQAMAPDGGKND